MIFGDEAADELFSWRNGLILDRTIETKFDTHQIVFVPATAAERPIMNWRLRVVDQSLLKENSLPKPLTWKDSTAGGCSSGLAKDLRTVICIFITLSPSLRVVHHKRKGWKGLGRKEIAWGLRVGICCGAWCRPSSDKPATTRPKRCCNSSATPSRRAAHDKRSCSGPGAARTHFALRGGGRRRRQQ